jgi:Rrf2 family protein
MKLELGRRADYAIRAVVDLARCAADGSRRKAREIAEEMQIPVSYVPAILAELVRAGLVDSQAGPAGGYRLARDPATIDLLQVLRAADGEVLSTACVLRGGPCRWDDVCAVHVPWARAQVALLDRLAEVSLAEVVAADAQLDAGTFELPDDLRADPRRADGAG